MYIINSDALRDADFLKKMDEHPQREIIAKIITLDWNEKPIREISGRVASGNISVNGSSACRRTCSLSLITTDPNVNEIDWQIRTKYYLTIGMKNFISDKYPEWIWFPLGLYIVTSVSLQSNMSGYTLSLQGRDKMCLLDGSVGGQLFATHDFGREELIHRDGTITYELLPVERIVQEALHVYAHEPYENIIINDLEDIAVELLDYRVKSQDCYIYDESSDMEFSQYSTNVLFTKDPVDVEFLHFLNDHYSLATEGDIITTPYNGHYFRIKKLLTYGTTAGYRRTELTYPTHDGELIVDAGGVLTDMLNKLTDFLGEFEYFYDVYGRFVFQRKRIYHQIVWNGIVPEGNTTVGYFTSQEGSTTQYDFTNGQIIESFVNKPNIASVRNDWSIWGQIASSDNDTNYACHLRYAIDDKPTIYYCMTDGYIYTTKDGVDIEALDPTDDIYRYWQQMKQNYINYLGTYATMEGSEEYVQSGINRLRQTMFQVRKVDWREIIYRMALDYANARSILLTLENYETRLPRHATIVNPMEYNDPTLQNFSTGLETPIISYDKKERYGYYDDKTKRDSELSFSQLEDLNVDRLNKGLREWTFQDYMKSINHIFYFSTPTVSAGWQSLLFEGVTVMNNTLINGNERRAQLQQLFADYCMVNEYKVYSYTEWETLDNFLDQLEAEKAELQQKEELTEEEQARLVEIDQAIDEYTPQWLSLMQIVQNNRLESIDLVSTDITSDQRATWNILFGEGSTPDSRIIELKEVSDKYLWVRHNDNNPALDWIYDYPYFGMQVMPFTAEEMNTNGWKPHFFINVNERTKIIHQLMAQWEKRMNSRYSIYFADMLAFWPLYYKIDNDLEFEDVIVGYKTGLDWTTSRTVDVQNMTFGYAMTSHENSHNNLLKAKATSQDEKVSRMKMAAVVHQNTLNRMSVNLNVSEAQYTQKLEEVTEDERPYYQMDEVEQMYEAIQDYIDVQNENLTQYIAECDTLLANENLATQNNVHFPQITAIKNTYTTYNNRMSGYYDSNKVYHQGLLDKYDETMLVKRSNLINTSFDAWTRNKHWNPNIIKYVEEQDAIRFLEPESMLFWLDFMDIENNDLAMSQLDKDQYKLQVAELSKYKISAIGHRSKVVNDDKIKAIFYRSVPDVLWIEPDQDLYMDSEDNISYVRLRLSNGLENYFVISTQGKSAQEELQFLLYENTYFQDTITISCLPIYYLEPNRKIIVVDNVTGISGEYIVQDYNISLAYDGMMSINANKASERVYY